MLERPGASSLLGGSDDSEFGCAGDENSDFLFRKDGNKLDIMVLVLEAKHESFSRESCASVHDTSLHTQKKLQVLAHTVHTYVYRKHILLHACPYELVYAF